MTWPVTIIRRDETRAQVREYLVLRGVRRTREGRRNSRRGRIRRDNGGFRVEVRLPVT